MHHFRGRLLDGDEPRLDPANVYIQFLRTTEDGAVDAWNGYLLVGTKTDVEPGGAYTLALEDGRSGDLQVDRLAPDDSGKYRANFFGVGPLR